MQQQVKQTMTSPTRSHIGPFRKAGAVPAAELAPMCKQLYHDRHFMNFLSKVCGFHQPFTTLPESMPHSCSLLVYNQPGDHISPHFDINYYKGRTITVLLTIINKNKYGLCCSSNQTCANGTCQDTRENSLLIMDGERILHHTEKLQQGEMRVVLSMVFTTDPSQTNWQWLQMKLKDVSFFLKP